MLDIVMNVVTNAVAGPGRWDGAEVVDAAGTRMHARVLGPQGAPDIVCVHGLGASHRVFLPFARAMAPGARVWAPDLPGFGRTPGPMRALDVRGLSLALADWLLVTGRGGAPLVSNSLGCQVTIDMAVHSPELLGPMVLVGPTMDMDARTPLRQAARLLAEARMERPTLALLQVSDFLRCGALRFFATLRYALDDPVELKLHRVTVPVLVVRGEHDRVAPQAWVQRFAAGLPQGRWAQIPGAGHVLNHGAPDELARLTRNLLGW